MLVQEYEYIFYIDLSTSAKIGGTCALNLHQWVCFVPHFSISRDMTTFGSLADVLIDDI